MVADDLLDTLEYAIDDDLDEADYDFDDFDDTDDYGAMDDVDEVLDALMDADDDDYSERRKPRRVRRVGKRTGGRKGGIFGPVPTARLRAYRGLRYEVRRNGRGIRAVNRKVGRVNRRVGRAVAVNASQRRRIGKLDKRVKLDGALEFAESWDGTQIDLFSVFKGAVKSGLLDDTKGIFASPAAIGGAGLLLNVLRNNPQGLGALFGGQGGNP